MIHRKTVVSMITREMAGTEAATIGFHGPRKQKSNVKTDNIWSVTNKIVMTLIIIFFVHKNVITGASLRDK